MSQPYVGEIRMFGGNFAPEGWALCNGQLMSIAENTTLFQLIGTTYGGDGQNTFALPDLQGRFPVHQGNGLGLSAVIGQKAGTETVTLTVSQIPAHNHSANCAAGGGTTASPVGAYWSTDPEGNTAAYYETPDSQMAHTEAGGAIGNTGGGVPHDNMQPFQVVNFIIALFGIFPSQN